MSIAVKQQLRPFALVAVALLAITAGCAGSIDDAADGEDELEDLSGEQIADRVADRHEEIEDIHGVQRMEVAGTNTTSEVWIKPPDKYRAETVGTNGSTMTTVANGTKTWMYNHESGTVTTTERTAASNQTFGLGNGAYVEKLLDRFEVESAGTGTVAGRDAYVVELTPSNETDRAIEYQELRIWIDAEYWYPLKYTMNAAVGDEGTAASDNETVSSTVTFESVEFNTGVDDERFEFTPPEDAEVTEQRMASYESADAAVEASPFDVSLPDDLPVDHELETAMLTERGGNATLVLSYNASADGRFSVSISQSGTFTPDGESVEVDGAEAILGSAGDGAVLTWSCGGRHYSVTGPFDEETVLEIGERIGCE